MKTARNAFGKPYECKQAWPEDCFVQCGDTGIVLGKGSFNKVMKAENTLKEFAEEAADPDTYVTAFFEAFPKPPVKTFIRGEGKTVEEAEANAFQQYQKFAACDHSMGFERRTYTNGAGFCLGCGMLQSDVFLPSSLCCVCGIPTNWTSDINNNHYCEVHSSQMPEDKKDSFHKMMDRYKKRKKNNMSNPQLDNKILELQAKLKEVEELNADLVKEVQDVNVLNLKKIAAEYVKLAAKYQAAEEFINFIVTQQVTSHIKITGGAGYVFRKAVVSANKPLKEQVKARKTAYKNYLKKLAAIEKLKSKPT